jgi:hypothetical protein
MGGSGREVLKGRALRPLAFVLLIVSSLMLLVAARAQAGSEAVVQHLPSLEMLPRFKPWRVGSVSLQR